MIKNNYKHKDAEIWLSEASENDADQQLALRVYTSRLIRQNPELVMHGGGNTSVKVERKNLFGQTCKVMHLSLIHI